MWKEFKAFALRGNVVDMAVGIIIGGAFGTIVRSLVEDVLMPPAGMLLGDKDFSDLFLLLQAGAVPPPYGSLIAAQEAGAITLNYGRFFNSLVSFLIVAVAMFAIIRLMNQLQRSERAEEEEAPTTKICPHCFTQIPIQARRCPNCTSSLESQPSLGA